MRVFGWFFYTHFLGERWRIRSELKGGYRALEVQEAQVITHIPSDGRVVIRTDFVEYNIRHKDGSALTDEQANSFVRDLAVKDLVELDQYDMALFERETISIPVENETKHGIPFEVKIAKDDEDGE